MQNSLRRSPTSWRKCSTLDVLATNAAFLVGLFPQAFGPSVRNDCLYVSLAELEGCELLTADAKLIANLQGAFPFITSLASVR